MRDIIESIVPRSGHRRLPLACRGFHGAKARSQPASHRASGSYFFVRVEGGSMRDAGILRGDILIVDRALRPSSGKIIIAVINGEFTVKRIRIRNKTIFLEPQNPKYPSIEIDPESDFQIWGIVTYYYP